MEAKEFIECILSQRNLHVVVESSLPIVEICESDVKAEFLNLSKTSQRLLKSRVNRYILNLGHSQTPESEKRLAMLTKFLKALS